MSIPLDRLYHFLEGLISDNIIIYRWYPHGSKKLSDFRILRDGQTADNFDELLTQVNMIFHDQEPLDFNYYLPECAIKAKLIAEERKSKLPVVPWPDSEEFLKLLESSQLRTVMPPFFNFNDNILLCHSEKNSKQLDVYEQNGFVGVYYWAHALIARDWYRYARYDKLLTPNFNNITHDFLIYGRAWSGSREYRLKFIELLINSNLVSTCQTTFNPCDNGVHYSNWEFTNQTLSISRHDFENFFQLNSASSNASADYCNSDYNKIGIEVVLETLFDDTRQHLTEKILRPIACGRPFILVGTAGSLEYLRNYGFKTFSGLIDESYDSIIDPLLRLEAIVAELTRISLLPSAEKLKLWQDLYAIASYNKNRFFSDELHDAVVDEFVTNYNIGIAKCKATMTGKWWQLMLDPSIVGDVTEESVTVKRINDLLARYSNNSIN